MEALDSDTGIRTRYPRSSPKPREDYEASKGIASALMSLGRHQTNFHQEKPQPTLGGRGMAWQLFILWSCYFERWNRNISKFYFHSCIGPLPEFCPLYESHNWKIIFCLSINSETRDSQYRETLEHKGAWEQENLHNSKVTERWYSAMVHTVKIIPK